MRRFDPDEALAATQERMFARAIVAAGLSRAGAFGAREFAAGQVRGGHWADTPDLPDAMDSAVDDVGHRMLVHKAGVA